MFCGVSQGSVLGQLLLTLYTIPLSYLIHSHILSHHLYVDDTQINFSLSIPDTYLYLTQVGACLSYIFGWMTNNRIRRNADQTGFTTIGTSSQRSKLTCFLPTPF